MILTNGWRLEKWFCNTVDKRDALRVIAYRQCRETNLKPGFISWISHTKILNISDGKNQILERIGKKTKYEIKRAEREGVKFSRDESLSNFVQYFNRFARGKGLKTTLRESSFGFSLDYLQVTKAELNGDPLAMHLYLCDKIDKRVRLLYSASLFREEMASNNRNLVGFSNRFLHYADMCFFSSLGFLTYDVGGYAYQTTEDELARINKFKDEFGGEMVCEGNYMSIPYYLALKIKSLLMKIGY